MCKWIYLSCRSFQKIRHVLVLLIVLAIVFEAVLTVCSPENSPTGVTSTPSLQRAAIGNYHLLTSIQGQGLALNSMVGPGVKVGMLGQIGGGESYALLAYNHLLYIAAYGAPPTEVYDPLQPFNATTTPATSPFILSPLPPSLRSFNPSINPAIIAPGKIDAGIRSQTMISVPDHHLYIGAIAPYGELSGPLIAWDTQNGNIHEYFPTPNQGVTSLTLATTSCQNIGGTYCMIGGTSTSGGGGTTAATSSAHLFSWDTTRNSVAHRYTIPNVKNPSMITDLITNPTDGYVDGIAINGKGSYAFVFNPSTGTFVNGGTLLPFSISSPTYNSVTIYHGKIWGITSQGVFTINPRNIKQTTLIKIIAMMN